MYVSVTGKYRDGSVELTEPPNGITESDVIVTFLAARKSVNGQNLRKRIIERMERGIEFTGAVPTRADLYADRIDRFS